MPTQLRFDGQVAVITGAGGSLGRAYALSLARRGARVLVNDLGIAPNGDPLPGYGPEGTVDAILAAGGQAMANRDDAARGAGSIVEMALKAWGRIDVVIPNAADVNVSGEQASHADWQRQLEVNVYGAAALVQAAWPSLGASRGRVILVSSGSVLGSLQPAPYPTTKSALIGLTMNLARFGSLQGVRVNAIMPSAYSRLLALIPDPKFVEIMRRHFPPEVVAAFVTWLSHESVPCNGQVFTVGGGRAARVFTGVAAGWRPAGNPLEVTPEDYAQHADQVMALTPHAVPEGMSDEVRYAGSQLGFDFGDLPFLRT